MIRRQLPVVVALALLATAGGGGQAIARPTCAGQPATIVGTGGPDKIKVGRGREVIVAGGGNDLIVSGAGRQVVCAGPGNDVVRTGSTKDLLLGGPGGDNLDSAGGSDGLKGGGGADTLLAGPGQDVSRGGGGADRMFAGHQDDFLFGGAGADVVVGEHGNDLLRGDSGDDWLRGDENTDTYSGGPGNDWASFATGIPGGEQTEKLGVFVTPPFQGRPGSVNGDGGRETIRGVENQVGSAFFDILGGIGAPGSIVNGVADDRDQCAAFTQINCAPYAFDTDQAIAFVEESPRDPGVIAVGGSGVDSWRITAQGQNGIRIASEQTLAAGPGCQQLDPVTVNCDAPGDGFGHLTAWAGTGNDQISVESNLGPTTTVKVAGGAGTDHLQGGPGDDLIYAGESGRDLLEGNGGDDVLFNGEGGGDVMRGGSGEDQLTGESGCGAHVFSGGPGGPDIATFALVADLGAAQVIIARIGGKLRSRDDNPGTRPCEKGRIGHDIEILEGHDARDVLIGDNSKNGLILGLGGNDLLMGKGGADRLRGGLGIDVMLGGPGPDIIQARDAKRDKRIDCGPGGRLAVIDGNDPSPRRC